MFFIMIPSKYLEMADTICQNESRKQIKQQIKKLYE